MPKVNNRPMGQNSTNLVTLTARQLWREKTFFEENRLKKGNKTKRRNGTKNDEF
jgi:hypothetical protein